MVVGVQGGFYDYHHVFSMSKRQKTSHKSSAIAAKRSKRPDVKEDHEIEVLKEQDIGSAEKKGILIYDFAVHLKLACLFAPFTIHLAPKAAKSEKLSM